MQQKNCPHCTASLPVEAVFCPFCAHPLQQRKTLNAPMPKKKLFLGIIFLCVVIALIGFLLYVPEPVILEGEGQVVYQDRDGVYQLCISINKSGSLPWATTPYVESTVAPGERFRYPAQLLIYRNGYDPAIQAAFMEKVASCTVESIPLEGGQPMDCTLPTPDDAFSKAALVSFIGYDGKSLLNEIRWTILMQNGDIIYLTHKIRATELPEVHYYADETPMNTMEELQALLDQINTAHAPDVVVNIHLPPVTYDGGFTLNRRAINLFGSSDANGHTTFTQPCSVKTHQPSPTNLNEISFEGTADCGLWTSAAVYLSDCAFSGWKTGLYAASGGSIIFSNCTFENMKVGVQYNTDMYHYFSPVFESNTFRNNGIGLWISELPSEETLEFPGCAFLDNGINIQNDTNHQLDLSNTDYQ